MRPRAFALHCLRAHLALLLAVAGFSAWPQDHVRKFDQYTLRASAVASDTLSVEAARRYGIRPSSTRAVVSVTVFRNVAGKEQTVPAKVSAQAANLLVHRSRIPLRQVEAAGNISYVGTYDFGHGEVLDFTITAEPRGSDKKLRLSFREQLWGSGRMPAPTQR